MKNMLSAAKAAKLEVSRLTTDQKNAALEAAAKGTWLGNLIETNPLVEKLNWLLSRRLLYIAPILQEYLEGGLWIKLMGLGYGQTADYVKDIHQLVEMEPVMLLLRHGLVGFCLGYIPVLAVVCSTLCYWLYGNALFEMSPLASAIFINLIPLTTMVGGVVLLGETLTWMTVLGGGMIIGSIFMVNMSEGKA